MKKTLQAIYRKRAIVLLLLFFFSFFSTFEINTSYAALHEIQEAIQAQIDAGKTTPFADRAGANVPAAEGPGIGVTIGNAFLQFTAFLAQASGRLFDFSIDYSLNIAKDTKLIKVVQETWGTFRDIANMFFIFVLLYIAFATMLQVNGAETKRMLIRLIVVGLLLNFSLFFAQVVIDVSNVLAYNFYSATAIQVEEKLAVNNTAGKKILSIAAPFVNQFKITSLYDVKVLSSVEAGDGAGGANKNLWIVLFTGAVFILVTAFIFLAGAFMFIIRSALLIILMVMAPIAFVMYVLPATQGYAKKWWGQLISNAFLAPVYLLFLWVTIRVMEGIGREANIGAKIKGGTFASEIAGGSGVSILFTFALLSALMIASLIISKNMSAFAAGAAISLAQKGTRFAGKNTFGAAGSGLMGLGALFGKGGFKKTNRALNFLGGGLRNRSYDVGSIPGAQMVGTGAGKDTKNLAQWWKGTSDAEFKRKGDVFKGITKPSAQLSYLKSLGKGDQEKMYKNMSPSERAELRISDDKLKERLDGTLSTEDRDKTEGARKTVASADNAATLIAAVKSGNLNTAVKGGTDIGEGVKQAILKSIGNISSMSVADIKKVGTAAKDAKKSNDFTNKDVMGKMNAKQMKAFVDEIDVDEAGAKEIAQMLNDMGTGADLHIQHLRSASKTGSANAELIMKEHAKMGGRSTVKDMSKGFGPDDMRQTS